MSISEAVQHSALTYQPATGDLLTRNMVDVRQFAYYVKPQS